MPDRPPSEPSSHQAHIPELLRKQLEEFRNRLWQVKIAEAVLAGFFGILLSFLIVFVLDRFIETSGAVRLVILIVGASLFAIFAPYWIRRWVYGHRKENQLAKLIASRFPKLGDRLLGAVELQNQDASKDNLSSSLRAAAMLTVAADAAAIDLLDALPVTRHKKGFFIVTGLFLLTLTVLLVTPEAGVNSLKRWIMPLSKTERFTFTQLDLSGINNPHRVPYGEPFTLKIPLSEQTSRRPELARARYGNDEWVKAPLVNGAYAFKFPAQRASDNLFIEADDAFEHLVVEPIVRPSMESITATVKLPTYLERPDITVDLRSGFLSALEGSALKIKATSSRSISSATASVITLPKDDIERPKDPSPAEETSPTPIVQQEPEKRDLRIEWSGKNFYSASVGISDQTLIVPIQWEDIYGLKVDRPFKLRIENNQDQAPSTYIQGIQSQHIMLAEETIDFKVFADDDYGVKACGISWQGEFTKPTGATPAKGALTIRLGGPTQMSLFQDFSFSPSNLNIEPQKLLIRSWTEDYKPERNRIYSEPITLYILTHDEHAQVLKNQFDQIIGELEDVTRKEQNLNDENMRLERKDDPKLQTDEGRKKLEAQQNAEQENQERMQNLTEKMENLFKDSVRNGQIDKEALKKMAKSLQTMRELSQEDLPKVDRKLQESMDPRNTPEKSKQDLKDAIEEQQKALKKMKQALAEANEANQVFEAGTFINRLKRASSEQSQIADSLIGAIDQIIGSNIESLDPVEQRLIRENHTQQSKTTADVRWIQEDLAHYFKRTQKPEHQKLADDMRESRIDESMEALSTKISSNISFASIALSKKWAKQLRKWAQELEGNKDDSDGGGGGGGGGGENEDKDFEFMLKVMRMIQKEQDLRGRTRALENIRRSHVGKESQTETPINSLAPSPS